MAELLSLSTARLERTAFPVAADRTAAMLATAARRTVEFFVLWGVAPRVDPVDRTFLVAFMEAVYLGQRVPVMTSRPGRIRQFAANRHQVWSLLRNEAAAVREVASVG